jgi:peroxiredoxin
MKLSQAKPWQTSQWLNSPISLTLESLRGKVILLEAFQMLCPGCVSHALPQAQRAAEAFHKDDLVVIGLHCVFEHHSAQGTKDALQAFLHEYRISFPVGIDLAAPEGGVPLTMKAYGLQGTPSTLLIDRQGRLRKHKFGLEKDMILGAEIMALIKDTSALETIGPQALPVAGCDDMSCSI